MPVNSPTCSVVGIDQAVLEAVVDGVESHVEFLADAVNTRPHLNYRVLMRPGPEGYSTD